MLPEEWTAHYNTIDYHGAWRGAALRSVGGASGQLLAESHGEAFSDTPLLARCRYFREAISVFECPLKSVRLLSLEPDSYIREHTDNALDYEDGEIRIHIPVQTNPAVEFYVSGERLALEEGDSYYVNVNRPHRVNNRGAESRIHLVIDAAVNDWVHDLFRRCQAEGRHIPRSPLPPRSLDEFRRWLLDRGPQTWQELEAIADRSRFTAAVLEMGRQNGFDFHEGDVHAGFRGPVAHPLPDYAPGWAPIHFSSEGSTANWVYAAGCRVTESFFEDHVRTLLSKPFAAFSRRQSPLPPSAAIESQPYALAPSGFIFHMSRCGSTLLARLLGTSSRTVVISEPPVLDDVLQSHLDSPSLDHRQHLDRLRSAILALGQRRLGDETRYFLKLDAWHIHRLPLLRAAFPETPWVFVFRDPLEVMASLSRQPGRQAVRGLMDPRVLEMRPEDVSLPPEEWIARVLEGILRAALSFHNDPHGLLVDYRELPEAVLGRIGSHFGIAFDREETDAIRQAALADAKVPWMPFQPKSPDDQAEITSVIRDLTASILNPLFMELKSAQ